jgi:hypothetical protein
MQLDDITPIPQRLSPMAIGPVGAMQDEDGQISAAQVISWKYDGKAQFRRVGRSSDLTPIYDDNAVLVSGLEWLSDDIPRPTTEQIDEWRIEYQTFLEEQAALSQQRWGDFRNKLWANPQLMMKSLSTSHANGWAMMLSSFANPAKETLTAFSLAFQMVRSGLSVDFTEEELNYVIDSATECGIPLTPESIALPPAPDIQEQTTA